MEKLYSVGEIGRLLNVSPSTVRFWEKSGYIPPPARSGITRKRLWSQWKLQVIVEYARSIGHPALVLPIQETSTGILVERRP